eukprot:TRINITY_DN4438_c0_g6_i1.p1 TRINITY_DN4438_c0_g6~~TRINITY_DN4438_c0_g6_i1.p1  ORF type:complete len:100 (+),score=41.41 TRINITY_DN4438_c0_g6_i1:40-300(+)
MEDVDTIPTSAMINSTLVTVGYPETLEKDLEYAGELLTRAVMKLKKKEPKVDFHTEPGRPEDMGRQLKSALVIKAVNEIDLSLEKQ